MEASREIFSIGHSNRPSEEFIALLATGRIECVCDVRRHPVSSRNPWFDREVLSATLADAGVRYRWLRELGGMRVAANDSMNLAIPDGGLRGYADHMSSAEFERGLERLLAIQKTARTAYMCAEADWRGCHRSILSDELTARGWIVRHIRTTELVEPHERTRGGRIVDGHMTYPAPRQGMLFG